MGLSLFKRQNSFNIEVNGNVHTVRFDREGGKYVLYIDESPAETFTPPSFVVMMFGDLNDYEFTLEGVPCAVAMRFGQPRIVVDEKYIDTGVEFKRVLPLPVWGYAFVIATMLPPVLLSQTFWDLMIGGCCAYMCTHFILKNPDLNAETPRRIVYCVLVTAASWLVLGVFTQFEAIGSFF